MSRLRLPIEVGQIWTARIKRRDGSRAQFELVSLDGREAVVQPLDRRPDGPNAGWSRPPTRKVGILTSECPGGCASVGNMRLTVLADGRRVSYPPGGPVVDEAPIIIVAGESGGRR